MRLNLRLRAGKVRMTDDLNGFERCDRRLIMYPDLNAQGRLFGGRLLEWVDTAVAGYVIDLTDTKDVVTVKFGEVVFEAPGQLNDVVEVWCRMDRLGRSSISISVQVLVNPTAGRPRHRICRCEVMFVQTDGGARSLPWGDGVRARLAAP